MKLSIFSGICLSLCVAAATPTFGQDSFDLNSQRKEVQRFNKIPGEKLDHKGIIINPTPQSLVVNEGTVDIKQGFNFKSTKDTKKYADDLTHLGIPTSATGVALTIQVGEKAAKKAGVELKEGAYKFTIGKKGVEITAFDDAGAFYGLQTLRELINSPVAENKTLPYLAITDYPALPYRGVVEGFYGTPWSHDVRMSLIEFYGRNKMNNYIFGPKDDPYHSSPHWRLPYPEKEAAQIHELVEASKKNRVNFVWAIHPGKDIRWNKEDYDSLLNKLNMMYDLGVRSFALFFDDIEGIGTDSNMQAELVNDLTRDFVKTKGDVTNLMICPTDYSQLWANPGPNGQLAIYGNKLNPDVEVFWTGAVVCSDLTPETLEFVNSRIKRPALYWWNYPVTDYARNYILQGPVYGLDTSLTAAEVAGIESNPMEHGEASKLALYGVADYAWNPAAYNPIDNWERGLVEIAPEAAEAYRLFAIHNGDTETGYRRDESWETETFAFNDYTPAQFAALKEEFEKIQAVPAEMEKISNKALLTEIRPWLTEFGKLGDRGVRTLDLIKIYEGGNDSLFWEAYTANLMSDADRDAYNAHKSGTMKLQPFYENAMDGMLEAEFKKMSGEVPTMYKATGTYRNLRTTQAKKMFDCDTTTYYHSGNSQAPGHWVGVDLGAVRPVRDVRIKQGRNSVNDVDYFDNAILEVSVDGKDWKALTDSLQNTYVIEWNGTPVDARYVRLRKLHSPKRSWIAVREFSVNTPTQESVGLDISADNADAALAAFDLNPTTIYSNNGTFTFNRPTNAQSLVILANAPGKNVTLTQTATVEKKLKKGKTEKQETVTSTQPLTSGYTTVNLQPETQKITIEGPIEIYEIIAK